MWITYYELCKYIVTCFENFVSEAALPGQQTWNLAGNWLVEARGNPQGTETELLEIDISMRSFHSCLSSGVQKS
jgi:hypothetical protein